MKRLHIHISVDNLEQSIQFYSTLFGSEPIKQKPEYAKWMLDDPRVNFAISQRGADVGLDHLGVQVDSDEELTDIRERLARADLTLFDEGETTCCYSQSDKSWVQDPSGIAWEAYRNMADAELFGSNDQADRTACCAPKPQSDSDSRTDSCC